MKPELGAGLAGAVVICTGAGGAVGRAVCEAFADVGSIVVAADLDAEVARGALVGEGIAVAADLRTAEGRGRVVSAAADLGPIRALVDCAALIRRTSTLAEVTEMDWDLQHEINLRAPFFLAQTVSALMAEQGGGSIVLFTSQGAFTGGRSGSVVYAASKGGIVSMTRGLARTLGPSNIRVNAIAPGLVNGPMLLNGTPQADLDKLVAETALGRFGEPEDIAPAAVFLASDHARFITGATINVSGGLLMY